MPEISVLMGVYYRRPDIRLLVRSVQSILTQTVQDIELLICDDGSTEEAAAYLDELSKRDTRIRMVREGRLFSLSEKLNACLTVAKGQWVARMDDDDFSHPDRFRQQLDYLDSHPEVEFVGCNVNLFLDGQLLGIRRLPERPEIKDFYITQPYIHPALMFKRDILLDVQGYSQDKHCLLCEDYDLLLRLYENGYSGANIQKVLFDYTLSDSLNSRRAFKYRINEMITRYRRFSRLQKLPRALPYVVKPILVGLLPEKILKAIKKNKIAKNQ